MNGTVGTVLLPLGCRFSGQSGEMNLKKDPNSFFRPTGLEKYNQTVYLINIEDNRSGKP